MTDPRFIIVYVFKLISSLNYANVLSSYLFVFQNSIFLLVVHLSVRKSYHSEFSDIAGVVKLFNPSFAIGG